MWERAYAVSETKRCVEGAAGTRGADKTIVEPLHRVVGGTKKKGKEERKEDGANCKNSVNFA